MSKDYYKILGVSKEVNKDEIKQAYRKLAHQYHPDKQGGDEKKFKEINEAYQVLSNDEKRQQYDQFGSTFEGFQGGQGFDFSGFQGQGFNFEDLFSNQGGSAEGWDFSDIFSAFTGGGRRRSTQKGKDIVVDMEIDLEEAFTGIEREISLKKLSVCKNCKGTGGEPGSGKKRCSECGGAGQVQQTRRTFFGVFSQVSVCPKCNGKGEIPEKECRNCRGTGRLHDVENIKIDLPAGVADGQTIRISGKGEMPKKDGIAGDLYIRVRIKPHKYFERKRDDIYYNAEIKFTQAVLGDKIEVPTLEGDVKLKIPVGTDSGVTFRLKGKGMPSINGYGRGDEYVRIRVKVPKKLSRKEEELIERLKEEGL